MSTNSLINSVRQYLASQFIYADDEWLTGCVEYLSEDSSNSYSETEIMNLAKEQWLLNDLKDVCPGSLPPNLKDNMQTVLNGRFVLQINAAIDIGTPAYQQYLKLQKVNMENIEATTHFDDKVPSHRMIKLHLTDGVQNITAIEYKPMRNLSCELTPGCKILIKGPVKCRRGMLLLTESAVDLIGGEVTDIALTNSLVGLLSSKLGLPLEADHNATMTQPRNTNIPAPHAEVPRSRAEPDPRPVARVTSLQVAHSMADDDINIDDIAAIEAEYCSNPVKRSLKEPDNKPEKKLKSEVNRSDEYPDENDFFLNEDEDYFNEVEAQFEGHERKQNGPVVVSSEPFTYIKQINDLQALDREGRVFKIKAQIMKLLSKLSVGKDGWSLRCTLIDGTGSIDADFTSEVLTRLVGFTPREMNQMKRQMVSDPTVKEKTVAALQKAKETLQVLYCIIELTILETAKITSLLPFEHCHVQVLNNRFNTYHGT
ncbi:hypothetical protein ACJJTC_006534 [Scirpophaga incertulas]